MTLGAEPVNCTTAIELVPPLVTYSVLLSGAIAKLFGALPRYRLRLVISHSGAVVRTLVTTRLELVSMASTRSLLSQATYKSLSLRSQTIPLGFPLTFIRPI